LRIPVLFQEYFYDLFREGRGETSAFFFAGTKQMTKFKTMSYRKYDHSLLRTMLKALVISGLLATGMMITQSGYAEESKPNDIEELSRQRQKSQHILTKLQTQIKDYQLKLEKTSATEKKSLLTLKNLNKQLLLYKQVVKNIQGQQKQLKQEIKSKTRQVRQAELELKALKSDFTRYAIAIYKFGVKNELEILFSSSSINQAIIRKEYIKRFSTFGKVKLRQIDRKKFEITQITKKLKAKFAESSQLLKDKTRQLADLKKTQQEKEDLLAQIKKDKEGFKKQLQASQQKTKSIQDKIQKLIMAEERAIKAEIARKRREEARRLRLLGNKKSSTTEKKTRRSDVALELEPSQPMLKNGPSDFDYTLVASEFDKNMGRLPWPVHGGVIVEPFGKKKDKDLKIVTFNNGVDISVPIGSSVHAVAGGKVTQIAYLPTFGNIVLIRHTNSYITVYANLSDIRVATGDNVRAGQVIGQSGKAPEGGSIVHFEVWKGRDKCNPEVWLAKK
jgi:septal ring factor EnvC (AmiA/AmiB activator)